MPRSWVTVLAPVSIAATSVMGNGWNLVPVEFYYSQEPEVSGQNRDADMEAEAATNEPLPAASSFRGRGRRANPTRSVKRPDVPANSNGSATGPGSHTNTRGRECSKRKRGRKNQSSMTTSENGRPKLPPTKDSEATPRKSDSSKSDGINSDGTTSGNADAAATVSCVAEAAPLPRGAGGCGDKDVLPPGLFYAAVGDCAHMQFFTDFLFDQPEGRHSMLAKGHARRTYAKMMIDLRREVQCALEREFHNPPPVTWRCKDRKLCFDVSHKRDILGTQANTPADIGRKLLDLPLDDSSGRIADLLVLAVVGCCTVWQQELGKRYFLGLQTATDKCVQYARNKAAVRLMERFMHFVHGIIYMRDADEKDESKQVVWDLLSEYETPSCGTRAHLWEVNCKWIEDELIDLPKHRRTLVDADGRPNEEVLQLLLRWMDIIEHAAPANFLQSRTWMTARAYRGVLRELTRMNTNRPINSSPTACREPPRKSSADGFLSRSDS